LFIERKRGKPEQKEIPIYYLDEGKIDETKMINL